MKRIKEQRREYRVSLKQLSEKVGIPENTLARMESRPYELLNRIKVLADFFAVTPAYLCEWCDAVPDDRRIIEKEVKVLVVERIYLPTVRVPECWKTEDNRIIRWMRRGKPV